jgi:hypothetical protein
MFGPSPLLAASNPQAKRLVAGWNVNSGQLKKRQIKYVNEPTTANVMAKVPNLVDDANDDVAGTLLVVVVVLMIRTPWYC